MSKILILLLYLFFITFCAYPAWNDYNVRAINNIEGLPDKHVNQILQDSDGFMWFATNNGLCRYDGYEFKTYKSSSQFPELLQSNIVNAIVEDIDHNLWIGTEQGLHFLDKSTDKIVCISNDSLPVMRELNFLLWMFHHWDDFYIGKKNRFVYYILKVQLVFLPITYCHERSGKDV